MAILFIGVHHKINYLQLKPKMTHSKLNKFSGFLLLVGLVLISGCTTQEEASQEQWDGKISSLESCDYVIGEDFFPVDCKSANDWCYGDDYPFINFPNWNRDTDNKPHLTCRLSVSHSYHSPCFIFGWCSDFNGYYIINEVSVNSSQD